MNFSGLRASGLLLLLVASVGACAPLRNHPIPATPLFVPDPREAQRYQALAREQDALLLTCAESHTCDRAHYARALSALYEDQTLAARHFQNVVTVAPQSRLASSSQFWLRFLQNPPIFFAQHSAFAEAADRLARDLLDLESSSALVLQREVKARDKKMEELAQQLDALKRIDQEMKEKTRPMRPPARMPFPADRDNHP